MKTVRLNSGEAVRILWDDHAVFECVPTAMRVEEVAAPVDAALFTDGTENFVRGESDLELTLGFSVTAWRRVTEGDVVRLAIEEAREDTDEATAGELIDATLPPRMKP